MTKNQRNVNDHYIRTHADVVVTYKQYKAVYEVRFLMSTIMHCFTFSVHQMHHCMLAEHGVRTFNVRSYKMQSLYVHCTYNLLVIRVYMSQNTNGSVGGIAV